jgi:hypothetical protein
VSKYQLLGGEVLEESAGPVLGGNDLWAAGEVKV